MALLHGFRVVTLRDAGCLEVHKSVLVDLGVQHPVGQLALLQLELRIQQTAVFQLLLQHGLFPVLCLRQQFMLGVQVVTRPADQSLAPPQHRNTRLSGVQLF